MYMYVYIYVYTRCPRRNGQNFGSVFLMLKYEPYPMALGIFLSSYVTVISCCVTVCSYVLSRVKDLGSSLVE